MADPRVDRFFDEDARWRDEARALRQILLGCGLDEDFKWGKPCYARGGKNLAILQRMNDFLALMFFKGALLADPAGVLESQGKNTHSALRMTFTSVDDVQQLTDVVTSYIDEAVEAERAGVELPPPPEREWVGELAERLADDAEFRTAFEALTPGRQRAYDLHFADAKQSSTRVARIDKHRARILAGKGLNDR